MADLSPPKNRKELYERIARGGKDEVILDEMVRLGFWPNYAIPPDPPDEVRRMTELRNRLAKLRQQVQGMRNLAQLEIDLKKQRMAESKRRREANKQTTLGERAAARAATQDKKTRELTYLGPRVSAGLGPTQDRRVSNHELLAKQKLVVAHTAAELAAAMKVPLGHLRYLAFAREVSTTTHYHRFTIPKRTGGERLISAPHKKLKAAQHWILEKILEPLALAEHAHGFVPGRSTVTNAVPHVGAAVVVNVDLRDFFPTVTYRRIKGMFRKLGYSEEVATVLALICSEPDITTTELDGTRFFVARGPRRLPQGAPTSPAITNVLCRKLDRRIAGWAKKHGFTYTRYADDLTVSSKDRDAPVGKMLAFLRHLTAAEGFAIHPDKVRVVRRGRRQEVTGVVVNERPGVPRDELRRFRALLYQIEKDGPAGKKWGSATGASNGAPAASGKPAAKPGAGVLASALGYASYVAMIDRPRGERLRAKVLALKAKYGG